MILKWQQTQPLGMSLRLFRRARLVSGLVDDWYGGGTGGIG